MPVPLELHSVEYPPYLFDIPLYFHILKLLDQINLVQNPLFGFFYKSDTHSIFQIFAACRFKTQTAKVLLKVRLQVFRGCEHEFRKSLDIGKGMKRRAEGRNGIGRPGGGSWKGKGC